MPVYRTTRNDFRDFGRRYLWLNQRHFSHQNEIASVYCYPGMMMVARGLALYVTNAAPVSGMPESFANLGNGALFKIVEEGAKRLAESGICRYSLPCDYYDLYYRTIHSSLSLN